MPYRLSIEDVDLLALIPEALLLIEPNTKLYRIVDFFSAADLLDKRRLTLQPLGGYSDQNEGFSHLAYKLFTAVNLAPQPTDPSILASEFRSQMDGEKASRYASCWSKTPESHAMWAMYSKDLCSIRLETSAAKLAAACANGMREFYSNCEFSEVGEEIEPFILANARVSAVQYVDIHNLANRLARRKRLADRLVSHLNPKADFVLPRSVERSIRKWRKIITQKESTQKDVSYAYEDEVRLEIKLGRRRNHADRRLHLKADMLARFSPLLGTAPVADADLARLLGPIIEFMGLGEVSSPPAMYSLPIDHNFIESVCIDPRAAAYKIEYMERYFSGFGVRIVKSCSFGDVIAYV